MLSTMLDITNGHELRRRATRDALREASLALFAERGFDAVSIAEVANAAGVTERTFYRHFPTKEAVLFQDYEVRLEWLAGALAARPAREPLFDSVRAAVYAFPHDLEIVRQAALLRSSLISGARIAEHLRIVQSSFAGVFADFVRSRQADDPDVDLVAAVSGAALAGVLVAAITVWGEDGCPDDIDAYVERSLSILRAGLAPAS